MASLAADKTAAALVIGMEIVVVEKKFDSRPQTRDVLVPGHLYNNRLGDPWLFPDLLENASHRLNLSVWDLSV